MNTSEKVILTTVYNVEKTTTLALDKGTSSKVKNIELKPNQTTEILELNNKVTGFESTVQYISSTKVADTFTPSNMV